MGSFTSLIWLCVLSVCIAKSDLVAGNCHDVDLCLSLVVLDKGKNFVPDVSVC